MIKKKELINLLKFLGVFCVFALGYMTIVGTGSDLEELLNLPTYTEGAEFLDVTVDSDTSAPLAKLGECWYDRSLEEEVGEDLSGVDIELKGAYAIFTPASVVGGSGVTCTVTIDGVVVAEVFHASGTTDPVKLTIDDFQNIYKVQEVINYPWMTFDFCGVCEGDVATDYTVNINSGVTAEWTIAL